MRKYPVLLAIAWMTLLVAIVSGQNETIGGDMGIYRVHGNVNGAAVYFGTDYKGVITDNLLDVPVYTTGTPYTNYSVSKDGYRPYMAAITRVPGKGQVLDLYATLSAIPTPQYGTLHFLVNPTSSRVLIDGTDAGTVPPTGILIVTDVLPGPHVIQVSKDGYQTNTTDLVVGNNELKKVTITLEPISTVSIWVTSMPSGALVSIDGKAAGVTPITVPGLSPGAHAVNVTLAGYQDYEQTVNVNAGSGSVSAVLVPVPTTSALGQVPLSPFIVIAALGGIAVLYRRKSP